MADLIGSGEAGRLLGVKDSRIRQLIARGELKAQTVSGHHLFRRADVEALAAKRRDKARGDLRIKLPGPGGSDAA
jgi:excisionase family DNA binding protein